MKHIVIEKTKTFRAILFIAFLLAVGLTLSIVDLILHWRT